MLNNDDLTEPAIQSIVNLTDQAKGACGKIEIVPIPNHPRGNYFIVKADGTFQEAILPPKTRSTELMSIDQVPAFVSNAIDIWDSGPSVYYSNKGVNVIISDDDIERHWYGFANVQFQLTDQFKLLSSFATNRDAAFLSHSKFMRMLRLDLDTCLEPQVLEHTLRACSAFESDDGTRVQSTVTRNRESLGREVMSELRSMSGDIPEDLVLQVRVFKDPAMVKTRRVHCKLETDPSSGGRFALLPYANELDNAVDAEMADLGDFLRSTINGGNRLPGPDGAESKARKFVPIFHGIP